MIEKLENQYHAKEKELRELREFTVLEKSIMDKEVNEKVEVSIKEMGEKLNQRDLYINQVEAELYKLADEKSTLNEKIAEFESELADLRPKCERVGGLFSRVQELQTELDLKETEMKKLVTRLEMASQRDKSLTSVNKKIAAIEAGAEKKDEVIHPSKHYSDQVTQLQGENMVLKEKLTTTEAELLSKTEALAETQPRLAELQKELENLQNEVGDLQDIIERETDENTENKEKITNLQREISDRRDQIEDLEGQVKQLSLTKKSLEHDYERLHTDHADMLSWYQKQQEEDILKAEGKDTESILKEQLSELRQEFSVKREAIVTMEMEFRDTLAGKVEELSNKQIKVETLTTDLEAFDKTKEELADVTNEKCELEQDIKDNIEQIAILQVDLEEKTEAIKSLKQENEALCQDSEESKEQITKLQIDVADGLETITELKNQESELEAKVLELQHDLSVKSEEVTRLNEGKASESHFQEQILNLQNRGRELEEQIVALEEELSTKSEEIKNLHQEKISESELQAQITKLQTELSNGFETITELKNKEKALHGEIKTLQEDLLKKTEIFSTLQAEVATDNEQITCLRKDLLESVNTVDRLKQERQSNVTDAEQTDNGGRIQQLLDKKKELEEENRKKMEEQETEWKKTVRDLKLDSFSLRSQLIDAKKEWARLGQAFDAFDIKIEKNGPH
ncbi:myosin-11 isoform X1 [Patella vulgata]|uniref:myosin-11 isoform X1 n=1 Tax=Patella vulgata TaxID=6465 RepID=UPI0024A8B31B|nr:myosin-11 isoform X1 [Patella vulgata]